MNYKLSPSDLTYLFEGCKYCFSLKIKHGITQPSMPMPGIFASIAGQQKEFYTNRRTETFSHELPPGIIAFGEQRVESSPIMIAGIETTCYIKGRFDLVTKFDDGSFGIIDCKTSRPSESKTQMYGRQLQAYAYALENPAPGQLSLKPITKLGLLYFEPTTFEQQSINEQLFKGDLVWHEVMKDDAEFINFIHSVLAILDSNDVTPQMCHTCEYCKTGKTCLVGKPDSLARGCTCCTWCTYRFKMQELGGSVSAALKDLSFKPLPACPQCGGQMSKRSGKYGDFLSCNSYPECKGTRKL